MADGRVATLQGLKQSYGDLFPVLLTELGERNFSGLPPYLKLLATVTGADVPPVLANELDRALMATGDGSDRPLADDGPDGVASTVRTLLAPMLPDNSDPDTSRDNQALADAAIALARHRIANGENPATAAQFAVDDLTGIQEVRDDFFLQPDSEDAESDEDDLFFVGQTDDPFDRALEEDQADGLGPDFFGPVRSRSEEFEVAMAGGGRGLLTGAGTFDREELDRFDDFTRRLSLGERSRNFTPGLVRDAADSLDRSQQAARAAASEEELALGKLLLKLIPGLGTVMNGTDAIEAFGEALELERAGKLDQAMKKRREAALDAVAALGPLALIAKADKISKAFRFLVDRAKRNRDAAQRAGSDNSQAIAKTATVAAQGQRLLDNDRTKRAGGRGLVENPSSEESKRWKGQFINSDAFNKYKERIQKGVPLGFQNKESFQVLGRRLGEVLDKAQEGKAVVVLRGSAVSGRQWNRAYPVVTHTHYM